MYRILRLSLRSFCSSSVSNEPSSMYLPAYGNTLKAIAWRTCSVPERDGGAVWVSSRAGQPLRALAFRLVDTGESRAADGLIGGAISRTRPASSCNGLSRAAAMVVQLGWR